jgi:hypothetical protein
VVETAAVKRWTIQRQVKNPTLQRTHQLTKAFIKEEKAMLQSHKQKTTKLICAKIKDTESVEQLSEVVRDARLRIAGFRVDPDAFDDARREDLLVLEALVVQLRKIMEAEEHIRERERLKLEEEEEDNDY